MPGDLSSPQAFRVGGVSARELAERFGTPLYAFDAEVVRHRFQTIMNTISHRPLSVHYSVKAHASVGILRLIRGMGGQVDACSPGDVAFALAAGFSADQISYAGHGMSDEELRSAAASGAYLIADSISQLRRLRGCGAVSEVGIRLQSPRMVGFHAHVDFGAEQTKFGIQPAQLPEALEVAAGNGMAITGLHAHLGSDIMDATAHLDVLQWLLRQAVHMPEVRLVDIGGGWGTPYRNDHGQFTEDEYDWAGFGEAASRLLAKFRGHAGRRIELRMEPGAYLMMDAGVLITRITEEKPSFGAAPHFLCTDTSYNHLPSAVQYGTYHEVWLADRPQAPRTHRYHVAGNLMQVGDILARDRLLPPAKPGDILVFEKCGAYKACRSSQFNERPRPAEVLIDGGEARLLRRRESVADLLVHQVLETGAL